MTSHNRTLLTLLATALTCTAAAHADQTDFRAGPLIEAFGPAAKIDSDLTIPGDTIFEVSFDVAKQAEPGALNRNLESAARFLNMHVAAGLRPAQLKLAIVVHGGASKDLLSADAYEKRLDAKSENVALLTSLMEHGVQIILCGQSAVYHGVKKQDLVPGVQMALSAMTAHALLQQSGYTLNPF